MNEIKHSINFNDLNKMKWMSLENQQTALKNIFWIQQMYPSWIVWVAGSQIADVYKVINSEWKMWVFVKDYGIVLLGSQRFFDKITVACDSSWFQYITGIIDEKHFCYELIDHWKVIAITNQKWENIFSTKNEVIVIIEQYRTQRMVSSAIFDGVLKK